MLPVKIQRFLPDQKQQVPTTSSPRNIYLIFRPSRHLFSLDVYFAITKFISKILRNQIQYQYISTQVVFGWVMPSDVDGDVKLACLVSDNVRLIIIIILQVRESASSRRLDV